MEKRVYYRAPNGVVYESYGNNNQVRRVDQSAQRQNQADFRRMQVQERPQTNAGGWGYLIAAAAAGFVAALVTKVIMDENKEEQTKLELKKTSNKPIDPIDAKLEECNDVVCPITLELMSEPVISKKCGHSFEEEAILSWLRSKDFCPKCHANLQRSDLVKNYSLKNAIEYMRKQEKNATRQT